MSAPNVFPFSAAPIADAVQTSSKLPPVPNEPPGAAGRLVRHIFHSALLPVPEVAIAAALGLLAGICGRSWNTWTEAQLNLYIVLVARSGVGKEHARDAIQTLVRQAAGDNKSLMNCVSWSDMASAPALIKTCVANPCFVSMLGEWGHVLKGMASPRSHEGPMGALRRIITSLYSNKAPVGLTYSDAEKSVISEGTVAFSMLAESTPATFYGALTADMLADGFMSRFCVIEYRGDRPDENAHRVSEADPQLVGELRALMARAGYVAMQMTTAAGKPTEVRPSVDALDVLHQFKTECAQQVRLAGEDEATRQMWNRANLKMLKVACLLAVADNCLQPEVGVEHAQWAISLTRYDIRVFSERIASGEVGGDDDARERKIRAVCQEYLRGAPSGYNIPWAMTEKGIIPRKYIQQRTSSLPLFKSAALGGTRALDTALKSLCDSGFLLEADKLKVADEYGFQGKCYRIINLPTGRIDMP